MSLFKFAAADRPARAVEVEPTESLAHALISLEKRYVFDAALAGEIAGLAGVGEADGVDAWDGASFGAALVAAGHPIAPTNDGLDDAGAAWDGAAASTHALYVIDGGVEGADALIAGLPAGADIVVLDASRDGVAQIAEAMASRTGVDQIHLFAHGSEGSLSLGSTRLDAETMSTVYRSTLAGIGTHLSETADILVYGCDFAAGETGAAAADLLASLTGADVAASTDRTGAARLGGDWTLEYSRGTVEAETLAFDGFDETLAAAMISASGAPTTNGLHNVGASATWSNVATVAGQPVDIRATVTAAAPSATISFGVTGDDLRMELENGTATVQWELFLAGTSTPVSADINFQITDLDGANIESVSASTGYTVEAATNLSVTNNLGVITAAGTQNQNSETTSMIRFTWQGVSSMTVDYTAVSGNDIRIFNHDGDLDLAFTNPVTVDTPVLDLDTGTGGRDYATTFTENGAAVAITDPTVDITNSTNIQSATVVLTNAKAGDSLTLGTLPGGISGSVDTSIAGRITVTLTGSSAAANYEAALHGITFSNSSNTPDTTARIVTFDLQNASFSSATSTTTIAVVPVNDAPVAVDDGFATAVDLAVSGSVAGNDSDPDGDTMSFVVASGPSHGGLSLNANGSFTYTPTSAWAGTDTFTYTVSDGNGGSDTATVTIVVNGPPVAVDDSVSTAYDTPVSSSVTGNDSDPNGDTLTYTLASGPAHGSVILNANGSFTYTPTAGYSGADSFTYTADDGHGGTDGATVSITVASNPNSPPVAGADAFTTATSTPVSGSLAGNDSDPNGDPLSYTVASGPAHGSVIVNTDGTFTYTPTAGYAGADSFTYTVSDGRGGSATATVSLTVSNAAPVAGADTVSTAYDTPVSGSVAGNDSDANGDTLSFTLASGPAHGSVIVNTDGTFTYTPTAGYAGADSFTYTVSDGQGGSATATVSVTVGSRPNVAPVAGDDGAATTADTPVSGTVAANDTDGDGDTLSFTLASGPAHGSAIVNTNGTYTYTPTAGWHGTDSFTYTVSDGFGGSATATVTITVNAPPVIAPIGAQAHVDAQGVTLDVAALTSDPDGPSASWSATGLPAGLTINTTTGVISGTLDRAASQGGPSSDGVHSVVVSVVDGAGGSASRAFTWTVTNPAPVAAADSFATAGGTAVSGSVATNDADPDGDALTFALVGAPTHGAVTVNADGTFTYLPTTGYAGTDTFTYRASDAQGANALATVTITVTNRPPTTVGTTPGRSTTDGSAVSVATAGYFTDPDGTAPTYSATGLPTGLSIDPMTGVISGTVANGASGASGDAGWPVTVTATDPHGASVSQSFVWRVTNPAPIAVADAVSTTGTTAVRGSVAGNDSDPDGDALTFSLTGQTAHGTVTFNADGSFSYTAHDLFAGVDTFTYAVRDANGGTSTATVTINVAAPTVLPQATRCITTFGDLAYLRTRLAVVSNRASAPVAMGAPFVAAAAAGHGRTMYYVPWLRR